MKGAGFILAALLVTGGLGYLVWAGRGVPASSAPAAPRLNDAPARPMTTPNAGSLRDAGMASQAAGGAPSPAWASDVGDVEAAQAEALEKIQQLTATYDAKSLPALAAYLRHADATVREAAREGVVQVGEAEGARYLREAADRMKNPAEALALLDAADFLELPPVNALTPEFIKRQAAERTRINSNPAKSEPR